jgi:PAS domain S-box-containing protein
MSQVTPPIELAGALPSQPVGDGERLFRAIFANVPDAILIVDDQARYVEANPAGCELLGRTRDELIGLRVHDVAAPEMLGRLDAIWTAFLNQGRASGEFVVQRPDGGVRLAEFTSIAHVLPGRHVAFLRDVSERRQVQDMRQQLAILMESAAVAVIGANVDGTITAWNQEAEKIFGYARGEIVGHGVCELLQSKHRAELARLWARMQIGKSSHNVETGCQHKNGGPIDVSLTLAPVVDANGSVVCASLVMRDVSEDKRLRASLAIADRMASVGTLAAGVAHEINNPLAAIVANTDFAMRGLEGLAGQVRGDALDALSEALRDGADAAERVRQIVRELKLFTRPAEERLGPVDVRRVLESTLRMVWNEVRHRARLVKDYAETPCVDASEGRLGQVFLNLLVNAAQAIPEGNAEKNEIRVSTRTSGNDVVVEISDTGCGIGEEQLEKIFEPFFTTKPAGVGTGLGLSICQGIVAGYRGHIRAESALGRGSRFTVTLPIGTLAEPTTRGSSIPPRMPSRPARILVVDDEAMLLKSAARMLSPPHEVIGVQEAQRALTLIRSGEQFDVILCDLMMPQMTGMELFEELKPLVPDLERRAVLLTGGAFTPGARDFLEQTTCHRLEKPFERNALLAIIRDIAR